MRHARPETVYAAVLLLLLNAAAASQTTGATPADVAALERKVQQHLQEQKPQLAIPVLREIIRLDPQNMNAQGNLGVLLYFQDKFSEAIAHLQAASAAQPDLWRIKALLGMAQKRTGRQAEAREHLEPAFNGLKDEKIRVQAGLELIELYSGAAQFERALAVAETLAELAPGDPQVLLAHYQLARQMMDQSLLALMVAAPESAQMKMIIAGELARQGERNAAIARYREAIGLNPALPGVHFQLAEQLRTAPDPKLNAEAETEYRAALQANPFDGLVLRQLGGVLTTKGDYAAAEESYRKALALQPTDAEAKTGLAIVLISTKRSDEALPLLESAVADDPANMTAHFRLSTLYRRAGRGADADREMKAFQHYKDLKDKIGRIHSQLIGPAGSK